ncbi:MAG: ABC transporter substrate-binding protein [Candidatus Omnitrophota bacterium]
MKAKVFLFVILFMSFLIYAPALAEERFPSRIISFGPALTEGLYLLGAQDKLVGCTIYCQKPPEVKNKEKVGTAIEVNLEKIVSLKPDLVLAISLTSPKVKEKLKNLGIKAITFSTPKDFNDICKHFLELGKLVGKVKEAEKIVKSAENKADSIKEKVKNLHHPKVLIQVGARPLFVANGDYFVNDYIEFAGGINIAKGAREGIYSREQALKANPDVIIIVTMGIVGEEEREIWEKYKTLNATKNDRIFIVDSYKFCNPTPVSFVETLEEIVEILHFKKGGETL